MLVLFWLGWYLCGPVCEMVDFWDPPLEEVHDVLFNAGGGIALFAAGIGFALALFRKFRKQCSRLRPTGFGRYLPLVLNFSLHPLFTPLFAIPIHSPPVPLRI